MDDRVHKFAAVFFFVCFWITTFVACSVADDAFSGRSRSSTQGNSVTGTIITFIWLCTIFHSALCVTILAFKSTTNSNESRALLVLVVMGLDLFTFGLACKQANVGGYGSSAAFLSAMGIILCILSLAWCSILLLETALLSIELKIGAKSTASSSNNATPTNANVQHSPVATSEPETNKQDTQTTG